MHQLRSLVAQLEHEANELMRDENKDPPSSTESGVRVSEMEQWRKLGKTWDEFVDALSGKVSMVSDAPASSSSSSLTAKKISDAMLSDTTSTHHESIMNSSTNSVMIPALASGSMASSSTSASVSGSMTSLTELDASYSSSATLAGRRCQSCHTADTPEWRRGPMGPRTLCNACGLVYSKMIRKKD